MSEFRLENPGLVVNGPDGMSCLHACIQMVMRARQTGAVLSFEQIDSILGRTQGMYSFDYAILNHLAGNGFQVQCIQKFDVAKLVETGGSYFTEFYGEEVGADLILNSEIDKGIDAAKEFMRNERIGKAFRVPRLSEIKSLLRKGYYILPIINQRILQADPGYVSHSILVYGYSDRGLRFHNPGPPASEGGEIPWALFEKAWSFPDRDARNILAIRPC
ncbi:MAG: hypothetical protein QOG66_313 [Methylobacteriaceae bacterium]|jgi:hypothetical protein|nr:hypothetical protein [Methylobacteriaceae bacterium]